MLWISTFYPTNDPTFLWTDTRPEHTAESRQIFCLRVDLNPQSRQRGRFFFLCVTMFQGWQARDTCAGCASSRSRGQVVPKQWSPNFQKPEGWWFASVLMWVVLWFFTLKGLRCSKQMCVGEPALGNTPASEICLSNQTKHTHCASEI